MHHQAQARVRLGLARHGRRAAQLLEHTATEVGPQHDVGIEQSDERVEVALSGGGKERLDDLALTVEVGVRDRPLAPYAPASATTVVSQPPRFSTAAASARLSRSHASWTASSASVSEPSIR